MTQRTPAVHLRPAADEDIPFLLELRRQTMTGHQLASGAEASERERHDRVLYRFECAQVILSDHVPVGILKLSKDALDWQLVQIQLTPALQSRGIGTTLIEGVIADARAAGASLRLNVLRANPARRLYERLGFRVEKEGPHEHEMRLGVLPGAESSGPRLGA